jgi:hypothetical protein
VHLVGRAAVPEGPLLEVAEKEPSAAEPEIELEITRNRNSWIRGVQEQLSF